jgi:phosphoglycerate kinase
MDIQDGKTITDDTRIKGAMPTIDYLLGKGAKVILCSHFGRPKGKVVEEMRLTSVAERISEIMGTSIVKCDDCIGDEVEAAVAKLSDGELILLENTRFHAEEEGKGCSAEEKDAFDSQLAKLADVYVGDAFGAAHRAHASTARVAAKLEYAACGYLLEKEIKFLMNAVEEPVRPMAAVIGGAKVSTKLPVLTTLMDKADKLVIGGGMIFTFYKVRLPCCNAQDTRQHQLALLALALLALIPPFPRPHPRPPLLRPWASP